MLGGQIHKRVAVDGNACLPRPLPLTLEERQVAVALIATRRPQVEDTSRFGRDWTQSDRLPVVAAERLVHGAVPAQCPVSPHDPLAPELYDRMAVLVPRVVVEQREALLTRLGGRDELP